MGQVLHGSATTTHAVRAAIQRSKASIQELSQRYGINPKTVQKWRRRSSVEDVTMGPKERRSTVLSPEDEALAVAFRKHTLLPLDDCLYALQPTIPHLTRSSLHRLFQRHDISRLPSVEGDRPKKRFKAYPIGYVHIDIAEVRTEDGKLYMFVAIDRVSKFAFAELHERATRQTAADFLRRPMAAVPYKIHTVLTDNGTHFTTPDTDICQFPAQAPALRAVLLDQRIPRFMEARLAREPEDEDPRDAIIRELMEMLKHAHATRQKLLKKKVRAVELRHLTERLNEQAAMREKLVGLGSQLYRLRCAGER